MADIELMIKIPEEIYKRAKVNIMETMDFRTVRTALYNGTPLPKGYGRLIDADALVKKMEERQEELKDDKSIWETACVETALDMFAPTIIEADKEEE